MNNNNKKKRIFIILNEGLHPVTRKIMKQFNATKDEIKVVTRHLVEMSEEMASKIVYEIRNIIIENDNVEQFYIVWTGMPVYNAIAMNLFLQMKRNFKLLVYNKVNDGYSEFEYNPKKLLHYYYNFVDEKNFEQKSNSNV